jgi:hypothetical protein
MPPRRSNVEAKPQLIEGIAGKLLKLLIYAHSEDIRRTFGDAGVEKTSLIMYENYPNLISAEKRKLASRFSDSDCVKQVLRMILEEYITSIRDNIILSPGDTLDTIRAKLMEIDESSVGVLVIDTYQKSRQRIQEFITLSAANDNNLLYSHVVSKLAEYASNAVLVANIFEGFAGFMRAFAMTFSGALWYGAGRTALEPIFWGFLISNGFPSVNILTWRTSLRPPAPKKPKVKPATPESAATPEPAKENMPEPAAPAPTPAGSDTTAVDVAAVIDDL